MAPLAKRTESARRDERVAIARDHRRVQQEVRASAKVCDRGLPSFDHVDGRWIGKQPFADSLPSERGVRDVQQPQERVVAYQRQVTGDDGRLPGGHGHRAPWSHLLPAPLDACEPILENGGPSPPTLSFRAEPAVPPHGTAEEQCRDCRDAPQLGFGGRAAQVEHDDGAAEDQHAKPGYPTRGRVDARGLKRRQLELLPVVRLRRRHGPRVRWWGRPVQDGDSPTCVNVPDPPRERW